VLDSAGKPLAGATLFAPKPGRPEPLAGKGVVMDRVGATAADGRFHLTLPARARDRRSYLVAHAAGLGVDWVELGEDKLPEELTLRLPKDVPITGRVVNTEGRPVPGVSVSASSIYVPADEKLDGYLAGWLKALRETL